MSSVTRPALRYFGSKWIAGPWIIGHFPEHRCYVELFGGGGALLLRKDPSVIDVYNDIDGEIVNFFRVLRERPKRLIDLLRNTPYARAELNLSYETSAGRIERARRTFVRMWQGHRGCRSTGRTGWRYQRSTNQRQNILEGWNDHDRLYTAADRLRLVQIEQGDALDVIRRFDTPDTLFYADPPYVPESRSERWRNVAYGENEYTEQDHRTLAERLRSIAGMAIVSGYHSPLYDELYAGWTTAQRNYAVDGRAHRAKNRQQRKRTEVLWMNPAASGRARQQTFFTELDLDLE